MSKRKAKQTQPVVAEIEPIAIETPDHEGEGYHGDDIEPRTGDDQIDPIEPEAIEGDEAAEAEIEAQIALPGSVVKRGYKVKYRDRARAAGIAGKAAKRSTWDWLAQQLAAATLDSHSKLRVDDFLALLDANGVDHSRWTNRSKGWEGRLRMTGRLALQRVVAETMVLHLADGEILDAPAEWVAKYRN